MHTYKLDMTRPMFLTCFIDVCGSDEKEIEKVIPSQSKLIHVAYTVLMEHNFSKKDIHSVHCDGESVVVKLASKALASHVKEMCHKEEVRLGMYYYKIRVKAKDRYVYIFADQDRRIGEDVEE